MNKRVGDWMDGVGKGEGCKSGKMDVQCVGSGQIDRWLSGSMEE